ncbi:MAG: M16 family metallopeptidase [Kofleriaceae bacterium]
MNLRSMSLVLALLVACGGSKPPTTTAPPDPNGGSTDPTGGVTATPSDSPVLPLWPEVKKGTLANGLTYYILKRPKPEKRAFLWLAVNAGSTQEEEDQRGLAHFVEHMAFNGTKRFPKADIINYLEKIGMGFGADLNASTNFDETTYKLTVPTDKPEYVSKGLDILHDWAGDILFENEEIEKERGVVLEEWRLGQGLGMRLLNKHFPVLFKGSLYATRLPIGTPEVIKGAKRERLTAFYKDFYRPDLMAVIAVGDVDPATLEKEITSRFSNLKNPANEKPRKNAGVPKADGPRVSIATDKELPIANITVNNVFAHRSETTEADFRRAIAEQIYNLIANERLGTLAKKAESPFTIAQVGVQGITREIDLFSRVAVPKAGKVEDALRALMVEAVRIEQHGFTQAELDRARSNIAAFYDQIAAQADTEGSDDYVEEITRNFYEREFMIGRRAERDMAKKFLPQITLEELNTLAKSFGGAANRVIMISGPEGKPLPDQKQVLAIVDEVQKSKIDPWQEAATTAKLMAQAPKPGTITKETKIDSIGVTEWTLSNGVKVVLKPTDFDNEQVSVSGDSPGGLAMANNKMWPSARFADDVVALGGVGDIDDDTLEKVLAGKRLQVSATIGETTESVDGNASVKDLETMFQLMYLKMTAPRKDEAVFGTWKQAVTEQLANQRRLPEAVFGIESQELLYKKHPRRTAPVPADIEKIDLDKAIAFYKDRFGDASDFTFVIVGSFDIAKIKPLVETYLASLPAKGRKEKEKDSGIRRAGGTIKKAWPLGSEPKAQVQLSFYGDEAWSRDKDRDMFILGQVLEMRLREVLREDMGGVYGVGAGGWISRRPRGERTFNIAFGCAPDAVDKLIKATVDEIAAVAKEGATTEQLEKIKAQFLRERETQLKTNGFWVGWLSGSYRFGDDPTLVNDPSKMIARMTSDNVKAAAKKYLAKTPFFQAVLMPAAGAASPAPTPAPAAKK